MRNRFLDIPASLVSCLLCVATTMGISQKVSAENSELPYWKDIQTTSVNTEYPRTSFMTYADRSQAMTGRFENSRTTNY